jgi:hypothetical protein
MKTLKSERDIKEIADTMIYFSRLVDAAPELLAALEMALDASENCINDKSWEDAARAAIARAKGN